MLIRTACPGDLTGIAHYDRHIPDDRLLACIRSGMVDVLADEARIVGVLRWSLFWQCIPFLDLISIDPGFHGRGWGTGMMEHWERSMAEKGFAHVLLSTQEDESAKYFYERLGYTLCGSFLPPEQDAQELIYRKELAR